MKTIETIMQEINQVMELVDEQELDQAMPLIQKNKRVLLSVRVEVAFRQKGLLCV